MNFRDYSVAALVVFFASQSTNAAAINGPAPAVYQRDCPSKNATIEPGTSGLCKASPSIYAPNVKKFNVKDNITLTTWAQGQSLHCDKTWFNTADNCWIHLWDLESKPGDYKSGLCRDFDPPNRVTIRSTRTKYKTECISKPGFPFYTHISDASERIKMYKEDVQLRFTCWSGEQGKPHKTYKTMLGCFLADEGLESPEGKYLEDLEECGPSPEYDRYTNQPDTNDTACATDQPTTTSTATLAAATLQPPAATPEKLQARFLRTTTIGEDYAPCRAQIAADSEVERYYAWNETITAQCYDTFPQSTGPLILLTTDFCWVNLTYVDFEIPYESKYHQPNTLNYND